jgi:site-specific recombinase XerD
MAPAEIARLAWGTWMLQKSPNTVAARKADLTVLGRWLGLDEGPELPMRAAFAVLDGPKKQRHLLCRSRIEQWAEDMKAAGLVAPTIGRRLSTMRSWLRELQDYGLQWSLRLPGPRYDPYNRAEGPEPALVEETIAKLKKPAKTDPHIARDRALIVLLYDQALRRMSAHTLDLEHIDFAKQRVFIEVKGFPDRQHRTITKRTAAALRAWIKHRSRVVGPVFCSIRGDGIRPKKRLHKNHLDADLPGSERRRGWAREPGPGRRGRDRRMTTIKLMWMEVFHGACVGAMRRIDALKKRRTMYFEPSDPWGTDIEGACAEMAVAKTLGRYWHAIVSDPNGLPGDAGTYQVRSTVHDSGQLVVYEHDDAAAIFVLVTGRVPVFTIRGWLRGGLARRAEWWREKAKVPAYFVPQQELRPMSELPGGRV